MVYKGRRIGAGDKLLVERNGILMSWTISDWSEGARDIYGRLDGCGDYENLKNYTNVSWPKHGLFKSIHGPLLLTPSMRVSCLPDL